MRQTYLEDLLPFALRGPHEVVRCEPPLVIRSASGDPLDGSPIVFYRHNVPLRDGATTIALAGESPILAQHAVGRGRVVAVAGTVLGEAGGQQMPFWKTPWWQQTLEEAIWSKK